MPSVGEPSPYWVSSMPPDPLYEQMTPSPGLGFVWIDGYWHWNGYEWVWVSGRWEQEQDGYVYVEPNYDAGASGYVYTPGYWATPTQVPQGWVIRDHHDGRPTVVAPPIGGYHPPVVGQPHPPRPPLNPRAPAGPRPPESEPGGGAGAPTYRPVYQPRTNEPPRSGEGPTGYTQIPTEQPVEHETLDRPPRGEPAPTVIYAPQAPRSGPSGPPPSAPPPAYHPAAPPATYQHPPAAPPAPPHTAAPPAAPHNGTAAHH